MNVSLVAGSSLDGVAALHRKVEIEVETVFSSRCVWCSFNLTTDGCGKENCEVKQLYDLAKEKGVVIQRGVDQRFHSAHAFLWYVLVDGQDLDKYADGEKAAQYCVDHGFKVKGVFGLTKGLLLSY